MTEIPDDPQKLDNLSNTELFARIHAEYVDGFDEELELELADYSEETPSDEREAGPLREDAANFRRSYFRELHRLQIELVRLQEWVVESRHKKV